MPEESKEVDPQASAGALGEVVADELNSDQEEALETLNAIDPANPDAVASASTSKKKKSKKKKSRAASSSDGPGGVDPGTSADKLSTAQLKQVLDVNPALKAVMGGMEESKAKEMLKGMTISDLLTDMAISGKNQKDMANYKFWGTQPVPSFEDKSSTFEEGAIKIIDPEQVPQEPLALVEGFEWMTMDLENETELREVYDLLENHYVEDDEAMFRFNYSFSFLNWALKSPGWRREWHIGVRASTSRRLVAFISGIPVRLRVRQNEIKCSEINFLCIHKKLRSKRLAPVLIKEITRRCYTGGIFQAIYTAGVVLPRPVATCRYFHRSLDWAKLYEVGFSPLPPGSTKERQMRKYKLPEHTAVKGLRPMQKKDADAVLDLLKRYQERVMMAQIFNREEVLHWLLQDVKDSPEQVVWTYVVEDPETKRITDFFSFYCLESTVIGNTKHPTIRAAYLYYYATEAAFSTQAETAHEALKQRLNVLMNDALILAKQAKFDVFNALTLLDNPLFLEQQKFGAGDGQLHYYLYNYRTAPMPGGVDQKNTVDERFIGGIGVVML